MTAIILPRRHIEQPQGAIEVDWAHPLAQGLSFIHHPGSGAAFLLSESTEYNPVAESGAYSVGYDRYQHGAYAGSNYLQLSNMPALLPTFTAAKRAMRASLFAVARQGGSNESTMLSVSSANNNPLYRLVLQSGRTAMFQVRPSGTTSTNGNATGSSAWPAGTYRVAVGVCRGASGIGASRIYVDGRFEGSGDVSLEDGYDQTWITEGVLLRTSAALYMDGAIALSGGYSRPLDDAEVQALSENPWQLFKARPWRIYFDLGAGGVNLLANITSASTTPTIALPVARAIGTTIASTSTTPAITLTVEAVIELLASIASQSSTADASLTVERTLSGAISSQSTTPPAALIVARALSTAGQSASTTPDTALSVQRDLTGTITGQSSTPAVTLAVLRALVASIPSDSTTPAITLSLTGLVELAAAIASTSATADAQFAVARALSATSASESTTPDITLAVQRALQAAINSESATPDDVDVAITSLVQLAVAIASQSSTPDASVTVSRAIAAAIQSASDTQAVGLAILRALDTLIDSESTTPDITLLLEAIEEAVYDALGYLAIPRHGYRLIERYGYQLINRTGYHPWAH